MKSCHLCKVGKVWRNFSKINLDEVEHMYLPIIQGGHFWLIIINLKCRSVEIHDSLWQKQESEKAHKETWTNICDNLVIAIDGKRDTQFGFSCLFKVSYPESPSQTNLHDWRFCVEDDRVLQ